MRIRRYSRALFCYAVAVIGLLLAIGGKVALAQSDKYWNIPASNPTPAGTWNTSTANWNDAADGSGTQTTWAANDRATFSAGTGATGAFSVTVSGTQMLTGLTIEEGTPTFTGGTLNFTAASNTINIATGVSATIGNAIISTASGNQVLKTGSGTLVLAGGNTSFSGEFVLNAGTVGVNNNNAFGNSAGNSKLTIKGGTLSNGSGATRTLSSNLTTNLDGDFFVDDSVGSSQITIDGVATIRDSNRTITVNGTSILDFGNTLGEDVAGRTLTKLGTGGLRFSANATEAATAFTGDIFLNAGRIEVGGSGRIGNENTPNTIHFLGGALLTTADRSASSDPIKNPLSIEANTVISTTSTAGNANLNFTGSISNSGTFTLTFRHDSTAAGTGVFDPRFSMGDATFDFPIVLQNNATVTTRTTRLSSFNVAGTTHTFNGVISGDGSYRRSFGTTSGGGTTVFTAANTYTGGTTVSNGTTLLVNNTTGSGTGSGGVTVSSGGFLGGTGTVSGVVSVTSGGHIAPGSGSAGTLTVGGLTLGTGTPTSSFLNFELGSVSDRIDVTQTDGLSLNGSTVDIAALTGFGVGTYTLIDYVGVVGGAGVASLVPGSIPTGFNVSFVDNTTLTAIQAVITSAGVQLGDFNNDSVVDAADYVVWRENDAANAALPNDNGLMTQQERYDLWRANFGNPPASGTSAGTSTAVPEPSGMVLAAVLGAAAIRFRRRRDD